MVIDADTQLLLDRLGCDNGEERHTATAAAAATTRRHSLAIDNPQSSIHIHTRRNRRIGRKTGSILSRHGILLVWLLRGSHVAALLPACRTVSCSTARRYARTMLSSRRMVLTTPESIIEQASTKNLLDLLIDESVRTSARRPIMMQFDPRSGWIWKRWKGTVFSETWDSCVTKMMFAILVVTLFHTVPALKQHFAGLNILWGQLLSVTTFTLTFFVNQSYALWRKCHDLSRRLQGRLHDFGLSLAAHARRQPGSDPYEPTTYTPGARQVLELISRYVRVFNLLTYASFTRSHRPILTPRGMRRLVERGLLTQREREILIEADLPATQRHNAVLLWIVRAFVEGREAGHFQGGAGFEDQFMEKVHVCRASYGAIGDELHGRMPLAYAHIVQVLVDIILWMYPFTAVASGMSAWLCVLGTGLLTVSYQGLFDLAKQFLDPYDNESFGKGEDPLVIDTLIAETNSGSVRWLSGLEKMPASTDRFQKGDFVDVLLPRGGYSVQELERKERERQELREREEAEKRRAEEKERMVREAAQAMVGRRFNTTLLHYNHHRNLHRESSLLFSKKSKRVLPGAVAITDIEISQDLSKFISSAMALKGAVPNAILAPGTAFATTLPETVTAARAPSETTIHSLINTSSTSVAESAYDAVFTPSSDQTPSVERNSLSLSFLPADSADTNGSIFVDYALSEGAVSSKESDPLTSRMREEITAQDYNRIAQEIVHAARMEQLETEAILNAAPGADIVELTQLDQDGSRAPHSSCINGTKVDEVIELTLNRTDVTDTISDSEADSGSYQSPEALNVTETISASDSQSDEATLSHGVIHATISKETAPERRMIDSLGIRVDGAYVRQVSSPVALVDVERLKAEKHELLETEAIMKAPPGADSVEIDVELSDGDLMVQNATFLEDYSPEQDKTNDSSTLEKIPKETDIKVDREGSSTDLKDGIKDFAVSIEAIPAKDLERNLQSERDELLETQAILNAPPAADSVEIPERAKNEQDDLAVLEMDSPRNSTNIEKQDSDSGSVAS